MEQAQFRKDGFEALLKRLDTLCNNVLEWGFFEESVYPAEHINSAAAGKPVAQIAEWNEYGNGLAPSRPFFSNSISRCFPREMGIGAQATPKVQRELVKALQGAIQGQDSSAALRGLGTVLATDVKDKIANYGIEGDPRPHNSDRWIAVKGEDRPLHQTGIMEDSVDYKVVKRRVDS